MIVGKCICVTIGMGTNVLNPYNFFFIYSNEIMSFFGVHACSCQGTTGYMWLITLVQTREASLQ